MTINSFIKNDAEFHLWTYEPIASKVPSKAVVRDGNEILSKDKMFRYPEKMMLGFGGNSYVGFSEIFRYKVLHDKGGWWSDMDVTCLKPLSLVEDEYYFRFHGVLSIVGNIMKVPPQSELMKTCFEEAAQKVTAETTDWHLAIRILCYHAERLGLDKYIHHNECNLDRLDMMEPFLRQAKPLSFIPEQWRFMHWMNSVFGRHYIKGSIYDQLLYKYGTPRITAL